MIQQPIYQDMSEPNDYQQQMMVCPVRVVYDTQMYVQPGEQVQQNPYVINPQNPPPWIKNQVIYVQNVPNNYMPNYQQHIDQTQYQNYGYTVPQMLVQNPQDPRTIQIVPANIVPNVPNINQRVITPNMGQIHNHVMVSEVQNPNIYADASMLSSHGNQSYMQDIPLQQAGQMAPSNSTESRVPTQQTLPIMANVQQRIPQFDQNNVPIRQTYPQMISTNIPQNYVSMVTQKVPPLNKPNFPSNGNSQTIVKTIQPRQTQLNQPVQQPPSQNIVYMNNVRRNVPTAMVNTQTVQPSYVKIDNSRKRKSQSPEETRNKVVISNHSNVLTKQEPASKPFVEIIPKPITPPKTENKTVASSVQTTPVDTQNVKIKEELAKPIKSISLMEPKQMIRKKMMNNLEAIQHLTNLNVQRDKLIRNTVFVQARGRVLNEPQTVLNITKVETQSDIKEATSIENNTDKIDKTEIVEVKSDEKKISDNEDSIQAEDIKTECVDNTKEKDRKNFLLTHVLDGYVIQESNVAFPIRRPLKEKTLHINTEVIIPKTEPKEEAKEKNIEESQRLIDISQLNLHENKHTEELESNDEDSPFKGIDVSTLKSWTVSELVLHLKKFGWDETISLLIEHEIDGESLFLVSKTQLMTIGICEDHATVICEFVKR